MAGADPFNAVKYQQIMMFLIAAATGIGSVFAVVISLLVVLDSNVFFFHFH